MPSPRTRIVVWSTGGVGSNAIRAVARRADLDLIGVWVHSPEKVGRDIGDLAGIEPLGLPATDDAEALLSLEPDCVIYAASGPERGAGAVPDYERLLSAGINVVTTTSTELVFPLSADAALRERLEQAAEAGGASLYASGIFPGFASDELARAPHDDVAEHPDAAPHRGVAQRPLPRRRRDDGRTRASHGPSTSSRSSPSRASSP